MQGLWSPYLRHLEDDVLPYWPGYNHDLSPEMNRILYLQAYEYSIACLALAWEVARIKGYPIYSFEYLYQQYHLGRTFLPSIPMGEALALEVLTNTRSVAKESCCLCSTRYDGEFYLCMVCDCMHNKSGYDDGLGVCLK